MEKEKRCTQCSRRLPLEEFYSDSRRSDGRTSWCRDCSRRKQREYTSSAEGRLARQETRRKYKKSEKGKESERRYARSKAWRRTQKRYRDSPKGKATKEAYAQSERGREVSRIGSARQRQRDKDKVAARAKLNNDIQNGKMKRGSCTVCMYYPAEAHHVDYSKPQEVVWLCLEHHRYVHTRDDLHTLGYDDLLRKLWSEAGFVED